jgi:hypothetical protein
MGVLFVAFGIHDFDRLGIIVFMGVGFIGYGIYWLFLARRFTKS